jgi:hypothetical protein
MADYFWSGVFTDECHTDLDPRLPVVVQLPRDLLKRVFIQKDLEEEVYRLLLKPPPATPGHDDKGPSTFFLQDFLTLMNAFGHDGDVTQVCSRT